LKIDSKLPAVGTTIFTTMSKMAADYHAINLSQGFPDFNVSPDLIALVERNMKFGNNQYAPMAGEPSLRKVIAGKTARLYDYLPDFETEITITAGATEGIFASIAALVKNGDEVIIFDPSYDAYAPSVLLNAGIPVRLKMKFPDFTIDWEEVKAKINRRTKLIIINTPHNPTGTVLSVKDLSHLTEIVQGNELYVLSDEVYHHIIFDGFRHESVLRYPALRERGIAVFSFGKTFHATGWKVGYCIAPREITEEIRKVHQYLTFSVNTPIQNAFADFLKRDENYDYVAGFYQEKRDLFLQYMKNSKFRPLPSRGTYFQLFSYRELFDFPDREMAEELTQKHGVAAIPISVFHENGQDDRVLRFCFAKNENTLKKAAELLCRI